MPCKLSYLILLISLFCSATTAFSADSEVLAEFKVNYGTVKNDNLLKKKIISLSQKLIKNSKMILEIEGAAVSEDGKSDIQRSYMLAKEAGELVYDKLNGKIDFYISANGNSSKKYSSIRFIQHIDRFEKKDIGITETQSPVSQPAGTVINRSSGALISTSDSSVSPIQMYNPVTSEKVLSSEEAKELDERITSEQASRASDLIERAKSMAREKERRIADEAKRDEAERAQRAKEEIQ